MPCNQANNCDNQPQLLKLSGAGEGNRTLVIITKPILCRNLLNHGHNQCETPTFWPTYTFEHQLFNTGFYSEPHRVAIIEVLGLRNLPPRNRAHVWNTSPKESARSRPHNRKR
jgi:hypothetical protein